MSEKTLDARDIIIGEKLDDSDFKRYFTFDDTVQGHLDELAFQMILVEQYEEGVQKGRNDAFEMVRAYLDEVSKALYKGKV